MPDKTADPHAEWRERVHRDHAAAVERGEHDAQCEWRPTGHYLCNCSKRRRERDGYTEPPGELIWQYPLCPRCQEEVGHDGDGYTCDPCCAWWPNAHGKAEFFDDHGDDLAANLAKWEARHG